MKDPTEKMRERLKYENVAQQQSPQFGAAISGQCGVGGTMGLDTDCARPGLLDRVVRQAEDLRRQYLKMEGLLELQGLLDRNPEVARILDLLDADILRR